MKNINKILKILLIFILIYGLNSAGDFSRAQEGETYDELQQQIESAKQKMEELQRQQAVYQKNIRLKQEEAMSLKNEIDILENKIAVAELELDATNQEIKKNELEIRRAELSIIKQEDVIEKRKNELGETLSLIHRNNNTSALEIFVLNNSISDFFIFAENTKVLSDTLAESLKELKDLKQELQNNKVALEEKTSQLRELRDNLELQQAELDNQIDYKDNLLVTTKQSEQKFYNLFYQAKQEQETANALIYELEKKARAALDKKKDGQPQLTDSTLIWPVPQNKITTEFHDPEYPFRYLFEHPAIDIRAAQGTTLRAAADGYVLKAWDAGMGYSYIALIHADGLSTVYGHVSKIYVRNDEYVSKGEVIGLTGGTPRTPGAGNLTTGPHLHFEVRLNGIPVDPLLYLP